MDVKIIEFKEEYTEAAKDLLVELQSHIARLDKRGVIIVTDSFRDGYFNLVSEDVKKQNGKIFIALTDGSAIGLAICKIFQGGGEAEVSSTCPKTGFISDLVVTENLRGRGIGSLLLKRCEEYFKGCGCEYTQLEVFAPNTRAFELYKKSGFEPLCIYMSKKC